MTLCGHCRNAPLSIRLDFDFPRQGRGFIDVILKRNRAFYQNKHDKRVSVPLLQYVTRSFRDRIRQPAKRLTIPEPKRKNVP